MNELIKSRILKFTSKRIIRGLHKAPDGAGLLANVNGDNMSRKLIPTAFANGIESCVVQPRRMIPLKVKAKGKSEMVSRLA